MDHDGALRPLTVSVLVPAHNESAVIGRLLRQLCDTAPPDTAPPDTAVEIIVVCNGCTDDTAGVAAAFPGVRVLQTPVASKAAALRLADDAATHFPRVYVDADVEIDRAGVLELARALAGGDVLAAAPGRRIPRHGVSLPVRWWYDVWENLPAVSGGLFGRGVIALSQQGYERVRRLPDLMSDDLVASSSFAAGERAVVPTALVVVHPPRTWPDLIRRRVRAATGTAQAYAGGGLATDSRTGVGDLLDVVRRHPLLAVKVPVFLAATLSARRQAARSIASGDYSTWLRDESSRGPAAN